MHQEITPTSSSPICMLVAEDHTVVRQAFCLLLVQLQVRASVY
jgi:hypothetical protein